MGSINMLQQKFEPKCSLCLKTPDLRSSAKLIIWYSLQVSPQTLIPSSLHTHNKGFGYPWLAKEFHMYQAHFLPLKTAYAFPCSPPGWATHLFLLTNPWPEIINTNFNNNETGQGLYVMPNCQLCRVPWPGSCWLLFTFQGCPSGTSVALKRSIHSR